MREFVLIFIGSMLGTIAGVVVVSLVYNWKENRRLARLYGEKPVIMKKTKGIDPKQTGKPSKGVRR